MNNNENKYCYKYPHPAVTTDCVIFGFDGTKLNVLLVKRGSVSQSVSEASSLKPVYLR